MPPNDGKPQLLALLICEKTLLDEDKVVSLFRIVDTFNLDVVQPDDRTKKVIVSLEFTVFTRWAGGPGKYTEELVLIDPDGNQRGPRNKTDITLDGGFHFEQIRHGIRLDIEAESGIYNWQVFLDGERFAEHPFKVTVSLLTVDEFNRRRPERPTSPEQP